MQLYCLFLLSAVLAAQTESGQIEGLVTTHDGSVLYFSTQMRVRSTGQSAAYKIFAANREGIRLAVEEPEGLAIDRRNPSVSGDGNVLAFSMRQPCSFCFPPSSTSMITGAQRDWTVAGNVQVSSGGDWAIVQGPGGVTRVELATGNSETFPGLSLNLRPSRRVISDQGAVVANFANQAVLVSRDGSRRAIPNVRNAGGISGDGRTLLFEIPFFDPGTAPQTPAPGWFFVDLASGAQTRLPGIQPALSRDGNRILVLVQSLAGVRSPEVIDRASGNTFRFPSFSGSAHEAVLSGDGRIVYVLTQWGVYRIVVDSGEIEPWVLYPPRFSMWGWSASIVPGSLHQLVAYTRTMAGLKTAPPPLPREWGGFRVLLNGVPMLLRSAGDRSVESQVIAGETTLVSIEFQVPWEFRVPGNEVLIEVEMARAPFEYSSRYPDVRLQDRTRPFALRSPGFVLHEPLLHYPLTWQWSVPALLALHEDLTTFVDAEHPARKGEVIHVYMTGLGPVDQEVSDGELPPGDPPARPIRTISCYGTETLDVQLAQGLIGIYRVSLRVLLGGSKTYQHIVLACDDTMAIRAALPLLPEE